MGGTSQSIRPRRFTIVLAVFGLTLLWPALAEWISRPFVALGSRLSQPSDSEANPFRSLLLGVATGLLWAPCAGPILGLILTGAALEGASSHSAFLLLAYAAGAATSLAVVLLAGGRVFAALKRSLGAEVWVRSALGVAVLAGVAAIALGLDRGLLTQISLASTSGVEQSLIDRFHPNTQPQNNPTKNPGSMMMMSATAPGAAAGPQTMPDLSGAVAWINSPPLNRDQLKGHVVLVDFSTYSCINCLRSIPYVRAWAEKYKDSGLIVIGVHTPEFAFEKDADNVKRAVSELKIAYPVALDNDYKIWKAFNNSYWPADYLIDAEGRVRHHHYGEGKYDESEQQIQELLKEHNPQLSVNGLVKVAATALRPRRTAMSNRPRPTLVTTAATASSLRAGSSRMSRTCTPSPSIWNSTSGAWPAIGPIMHRLPLWTRREARSCSGFTPGMCIWCWGPHPVGNRFAFKSGLTARRRERVTEWIPTRKETEKLPSSASINSSVKRTPLKTTPLKSSFSIPARRLSPSLLGEANLG